MSRKNKKERKLLPLRKTIQRPFLIATSVMSVAVIVFFNAVMLILLYTDAVSETRSVAGVVDKMCSEQIGREELTEIYKAELDRRLPSSKMSLLTVRGSEKVYSTAEYTQNELSIILNKIEKEQGKGDMSFQADIGGDIIIISPLSVSLTDGERGYICASLVSVFATLKEPNEILLVIIALSAVALIIVSKVTADKISDPIKELGDYMEVIGDGDFSHIDVTENSKELEKLTSSINGMLTKLQAYHDVHTMSLQNLSHDLRTPLMSISGYAEGIKYGVIDDTETAADVIISESKKLTGVVEKIIILSELDTLNQPINMIPTKLYDFINNEIERIHGYALSEKVTIRMGTENRGFEVLADRQLLTTIIQNLLSNAIRYADEFVDVKVFKEDGGKISISVRDDGRGLSDKDLEHLFTRYYVGETGHTGLGLSASKAAAKYMGCSIKGENRPHGGAEFTVTFPEYI